MEAKKPAYSLQGYNLALGVVNTIGGFQVRFEHQELSIINNQTTLIDWLP